MGIAVGFMIVFFSAFVGFLLIFIVDWIQDLNEMRREYLKEKRKEEERCKKDNGCN